MFDELMFGIQDLDLELATVMDSIIFDESLMSINGIVVVVILLSYC